MVLALRDFMKKRTAMNIPNNPADSVSKNPSDVLCIAVMSIAKMNAERRPTLRLTNSFPMAKTKTTIIAPAKTGKNTAISKS